MTHSATPDSETFALAARFLGVLFSLTELTEDETPDDVVAQLSVNQLRALNLIYREPGISQKALAERLEITPASVSISIGKMLETELVEKYHNETDGRFMRLYLGTRGQDLVRKVEAAQTRSIAALLDGLPLEEQRNVVETLERALRVRGKNPETAHAVEG
jgi:DNA-binding MarR family transcriptional regulator